MEDADMKTLLVVTMPDGSLWTVPVRVIARHRAKHYAGDFGGDVYRSMEEDTIPLFTRSENQIMNWARHNMNWSMVEHHAYKNSSPEPDFQEGWASGEMKVLP
jgi:hypothetical protein